MVYSVLSVEDAFLRIDKMDMQQFCGKSFFNYKGYIRLFFYSKNTTLCENISITKG